MRPGAAGLHKASLNEGKSHIKKMKFLCGYNIIDEYFLLFMCCVDNFQVVCLCLTNLLNS